jgi:hypothetical protein
MQAQTSEPIGDEVGRLKACINDLTSLLALPAIWTGREPHQIITALLDVLMRVLRLDAAYAQIKDPVDDALISMTRPVLRENPTEGQMVIEQALKIGARKISALRLWCRNNRPAISQSCPCDWDSRTN